MRLDRTGTKTNTGTAPDSPSKDLIILLNKTMGPCHIISDGPGFLPVLY
jgi:hypothetical protein